MSPLNVFTLSWAETDRGNCSPIDPLTVCNVTLPPGASPVAATFNPPDTASAASRCTRPASSLMLPDTVSADTSPAPPVAWIEPLTARRSSRVVCTCERMPPLTEVSAVSPLRPAAAMSPLTALACSRRTSTSATSISALTVPSCTSTARGTRSSSVAPPLLPLRG
ncbi:hypothetical protein D3C72_1844960 [compost metagenome]